MVLGQVSFHSLLDPLQTEHWAPSDLSNLIAQSSTRLFGMRIFAVGNQLKDKVDNPRNWSNADADKPLLRDESIAGVDTEGLACESDEQHLQANNPAYDHKEEWISGDSFEDIELFMQFSGVKEVEDLHHHESVKDESEMPWVNSDLEEDCVIVTCSWHCVKPSASHCASYDSVVPLVLWTRGEDWRVIWIGVLRDELFSTEYESEDDNELEDTLTDDVLKHALGNDVLITGVRLTFKQVISWLFSS